jgi:RNA polymerase sigma-70 factor (family 1)
MAYVKLNDDELLVLLKQNNRTAYIEIYNRYWKKMLLVAWNYSRNDHIAQDVVQEVFINLWEKYHKYDIQNLQAFLCTAIKFQIFKHIQKEQRRAELAKDNYVFEDISLDEEKLDARFLQDMINGIVEEMPERCRMVFHYSRNLGLKNAEIAEKTNISKKTVENTLNRALKIIRGELKNHGFPFILILKLFLSIFR